MSRQVNASPSARSPLDAKMEPTSSNLVAGFGKADITPASDGSFRVLDPIFFRALHLRRGPVRATLLAADLFLLDDGFEAMVVEELGPRAAEAGPLWRDPSHLATAPIFEGHYVLQPCTALRHFGRERDYARRAADAIRAALDNAREATAGVAVTDAPADLAFNRRAYDRDGRFSFVSLSRHLTAPPELTYRPADRRVGVVTFRRPGARPIALINYGCHALSLISQLGHVSGDYPGLLCQALDRDGIDALFFQGALGDVAPNRVGAEPAGHIAEALRHAVLPLIRDAASSDAALHAAETSLELPLRLLPPTAESRAALEEAERTGRPDNTARFRLWLGRRFAGVERHTLRLRALALGDAILLHVPGEPFADFALELRRRLGIEKLLVLAGPCPEVGYLATPLAHREGENEAIHSTLQADTEPLVREAAASLLRGLRARAAETAA